jgi:two-component system CheB/CheR fusion protein
LSPDAVPNEPLWLEVDPDLRADLQAALAQAQQTDADGADRPPLLQVGGRPCTLGLRLLPASEAAPARLQVVWDDRPAGTEARQAQEALSSSEERLRLVIENAREYAIFSTDLQRRVTSWNTGAQRILGLAEHEAMGRVADFIFTPEDRAAGAPEREARTALAQGRAADERFHQRRDGSLFWASGALMLMRSGSGEAVGFVKILRDQSAARAQQQALERSQAELLQALEATRRARDALQQADAAKDRFLAVLSHELRNPLASIDSAAALLTAPETSAADRATAGEVVARQAATMKILLDDLLDISRLTLGRLVLQREAVSLAAVLERSLEGVRPLLASGRQALSLDLPPDTLMLDADSVRLSQVFSNLLTNAVKYTPAGGTIALRARLEGAEAVVTVTDSGIGMEPGQIEDMFELFTQGHADDRRSQGGLGIGLALARSIVQLHGGSIAARSAGLGQGSEFSVRLPIARGLAAPGAGSAAAAPAAPARAAGKPGLILIADDNVDAGWGMARLLEVAGYRTVLVRGGHDALQEARRQMPDIAILDIGMPDLSGLAVAQELRAMEGGASLVLIAATGWGQPADESASLAAGFDAHMTKPVNLRQLSALVDELMDRRRRT